ncbi:MAG: hypothetical protein EAZ50_09370 [Runella slithyformis]|nr:MAG: hypothetical protein EAY79_05195 [Runella slithyformis]TAF80211.1 MAG: hypothetical protein EAZ50_09370 [Runella slithyformis]
MRKLPVILLVFWFATHANNIVYNYLGLVEKLELTNGRSIAYVFDAEGQKLRKTISETGKPDFIVDYMGGLIYHDGKLVSIDTPEGRAVPLDSTNQDFTYQFFYNDHLGNLRVAYSVAPNGAIITQENHYGPMGELLEGISSNSESYPYLFQGKEREFSWGIDLDDFHSRMYGAWENRMWQVDGADQFASGYVGMGNNAINGIDPDGQAWHIVAGAIIGGAVNLYRNWDAVAQTKGGMGAKIAKGAAFFGLGALEGAFIAAAPGAGFAKVAVSAAGRAVIAGTVKSIGNVVLGGNPDQLNPTNILRDAAITGITAGVASGISAVLKGGNFLYGTGRAYGTPPTITQVTDELGNEIASKMVGKTAQATTNLNLGKLTGTVWDDIIPTQGNYIGTQLPKSFQLNTPNGTKVWVHPNATEHIAENLLGLERAGTISQGIDIATQQSLKSLQSAVNEATKQVMHLNQRMLVGGWQLEFSKSAKDILPVLKHARPIR